MFSFCFVYSEPPFRNVAVAAADKRQEQPWLKLEVEVRHQNGFQAVFIIHSHSPLLLVKVLLFTH